MFTMQFESDQRDTTVLVQDEQDQTIATGHVSTGNESFDVACTVVVYLPAKFTKEAEIAIENALIACTGNAAAVKRALANRQAA